MGRPIQILICRNGNSRNIDAEETSHISQYMHKSLGTINPRRRHNTTRNTLPGSRPNLKNEQDLQLWNVTRPRIQAFEGGSEEGIGISSIFLLISKGRAQRPAYGLIVRNNTHTYHQTRKKDLQLPLRGRTQESRRKVEEEIQTRGSEIFKGWIHDHRDERIQRVEILTNSSAIHLLLDA